MADNYDPREIRPGYYELSRIHPVTRKKVNFRGTDKAIIVARARVIDDLKRQHAAGMIGEAELARQTSVATKGAVTVRELWEDYFPKLEGGTARAYEAAWKHRLEKPFGDLPAYEITEGRLNKWLAEERETLTARGKPPSMKTIANAWEALKGALKLGLGDKRLKEPPWGKFTVKVHKPDHLEREILRDTEELARYLAVAAERDAQSYRGGGLGDLARRVVVMVFLCLRQGELAALGWDDLRTQGGTAYLKIRHNTRPGWRIEHPEWTRPMDHTKGKKAVRLPLHPDVIRALAAQRRALEARGWYRKDGPIFPGRNGEWRSHPRIIDPEDARAIFGEAIPEGDAASFVTHSHRHTGATLTVIATGGDTARAKKLTRHKSDRMLAIYTHEGGRGDVSPLPALPRHVTDKLIPAARSGLLLEAAAGPLGRVECEEVDLGREAELGAEDADDILEPVELEQVEGELPELADLTAVTPDAARSYESIKKERRRQSVRESKAKAKGRLIAPFEELYAKWDAEGRTSGKLFPPEVAKLARDAYQLSYARTLRAAKALGWKDARVKVQKNQRTWEAIARAHLRELRDDELAGEVAAIRSKNGERPRPPEPGNYVTIPVTWEAQRKARRARRARLASWFGVVKKNEKAAASASRPELEEHM